jgi:hypothetical protein
MDREVAQMVMNTASRAAVELGNLMPLLKAHGDAGDDPVRKAIASATYEIGLVRDQVFAQFPDLKAAAEARMSTYQRSYY